MGSKRKASTPVRWQPHAELTMAATLGAGSSQLGGARRSGMDMEPPPPVERNLLSRFKGDAKPQSKSARPAPPLALSLRVGSEEEETRNRSVNAAIRGHDDSSHPSPSRRGSGPGRRVPQQPVQAAAAAPSFRPLSPLPWLAMSVGPARQSPVPLPSSAGAPPQMRAPGSPAAGAGPQLAAGAARRQLCDMCSFYGSLLVVLRGQLWSSREELELERRKVWQLQLAAASSAGGCSLVCPACWARPAAAVLAPHDEHLHLCLCRRCLAATRGDPSIACARCAVARARAAEAAAPR